MTWGPPAPGTHESDLFWPPPAPGTHESDLGDTLNGRPMQNYTRINTYTWGRFYACVEWSRMRTGRAPYFGAWSPPNGHPNAP